MEEKDQSVWMEVRCPCTGSVLSMIRNFVSCVAREMGFHEDEVAQIEISTDEACSNVIRHAYEIEKNSAKGKQGQCQSQIKVFIKTTEDSLRITICDYGIGDKAGIHNGIQNLDEYVLQGHGLGTYIIQQFMDKVEVDYPTDAGTTVSMVKFLPKRR